MSSKMEVTDTQITKDFSDGDDNLKAFATVTINNSLVIRGLKVIDGSKGLFMSWPSRKNPNNKERPYIDVVYTTDKDLYRDISDAVIDAYKKNKRSGSSGKRSSRNDDDI